MAEKLKNIFFSNSFLEQLATNIHQIYPKFEKNFFLRSILEDDWEKKELKERMHHITRCLNESLKQDYLQSLHILRKIAPGFHGFDAMIFPDFVEMYGINHIGSSFTALKEFTQQCSSEFAVRPFLAAYPLKTLDYFYTWAEDANKHVRRLASEGCRPRLPWAMALPEFKRDPGPIIPVLEKLKNDQSEYVRRSVANNLNDISKDHPDLMLDLCEQWYGQSENTNAMIKHACRGLLKSGNKRALLLFGFLDPNNICVEKLKIDREHVAIGDEISFLFELSVSSEKTSKIRLEYAVDFVKSTGKLSHKIFQIKEAEYNPGQYKITKKHSFKNFSTRKHFPGKHKIYIIVNGEKKATKSFELLP